jgi:hypothetical protein
MANISEHIASVQAKIGGQHLAWRISGVAVISVAMAFGAQSMAAASKIGGNLVVGVKAHLA